VEHNKKAYVASIRMRSYYLPMFTPNQKCVSLPVIIYRLRGCQKFRDINYIRWSTFHWSKYM